jgi:hypothetical protein
MKLRKSLFALLAVSGIVLVSTFINIYSVRDGAGGTLFWKDNTAYLFLNVGRFGYRTSCLQYAGEIIEEILGGARSPSDKRFYVVVLQITPEEAQKYVAKDLYLGSYAVSDGSIYSGDLNDGILWKWDGGAFDRVNEADRQSFTKDQILNGPDYDNVDGWHERCCFLSRSNEYNYVVNLNVQTFTVVARREGVNQLSIDLSRPGQNPERLWSLSERPHIVSKAEYQRTFGK